VVIDFPSGLGDETYQEHFCLQAVHVQHPQRQRQHELPSELDCPGGVEAAQLQLLEAGEPAEVQPSEPGIRSQRQRQAQAHAMQLRCQETRLRSGLEAGVVSDAKANTAVAMLACCKSRNKEMPRKLVTKHADDDLYCNHLLSCKHLEQTNSQC